MPSLFFFSYRRLTTSYAYKKPEEPDVYTHFLNKMDRNHTPTHSRSQSSIEGGGHILNAWRHEPNTMPGGPLVRPPPSPARAFGRSTGSSLRDQSDRVHVVSRHGLRGMAVGPMGNHLNGRGEVADTALESMTYDAGFEAAIQYLQELMKRGRGTRRPGVPQAVQPTESPHRDFLVVDMVDLEGAENLVFASAGLPRMRIMPTMDSPLMTPPEHSLFTRAVEEMDVKPYIRGGDFRNAPDLSNSSDSWMIHSHEHNRRAEQRRADADYEQHRKLNDGTRFKIRTDLGGNIVTNKLRVTSMIKKLMDVYVDVSQIHYNDNDEKFILVENMVCGQFEFEPPLKKSWFPYYMRKRLEKERCEYRKYYDENAKMHPDYKPEKHHALLAWWTSPSGKSNAHRLKEMNTARATERLALNAVGYPIGAPIISQRETNVMEDASVNVQSRASTPTVALYDGTSTVRSGEVNSQNKVEEPLDLNVSNDTASDNDPSTAEQRVSLGVGIQEAHYETKRAEVEVDSLKRNVTDILTGLNSFYDLPNIMEKVKAVLGASSNGYRHTSVDVPPSSSAGQTSPTRDISHVSQAGGNYASNDEDTDMNEYFIKSHDKRKRQAEDSDESGGKFRTVTRQDNKEYTSPTPVQPTGEEISHGDLGNTAELKKKQKIVNSSATEYGRTIASEAYEQGHTVEHSRGATIILEGSKEGICAGGVIISDAIREELPSRPAVASLQIPKRTSKFVDREPPSALTPKGHQKKYPLGMNKDVWVLYPTKVGGPVALGKTRFSFKTTKSKLQSSLWRSLKWEQGVQLVEIIKVLMHGVKVMHPTKQPNREVKTLDDVTDVEFADESLVMWGTEYLVEVIPPTRKGKLK
ncbi:hypothetical protein M758_3G144100 [Ceratodon purpureus]|nr:hypothetical protein M758_3G144100 [Ceratodon purpureus]